MVAGKTQQPGGSGRGPDEPMLWPFAAARLAMDACFWWLERGPAEQGEGDLPWTTPGTVALELATMRLRDCSRTRSGQPALVCAPYALHRALIADFAPGHSVVQSLQQGGIDRIYLTDWRSATPDMRYLSIDSYLGDLNVAVDEIGSPVDLVGLCQGGWLSLLYAARFPAKVRRLVLAGAPVDLSVEVQAVATCPQRARDGLRAARRARRRQCQRRGDAACLVEGARPRRHRGGIAERPLGRGGRGPARALRPLEQRAAQSPGHLLSPDRQLDLSREPHRQR